MVLIAEFKQRRFPSDKSRPYHRYCLTTLYSLMFDEVLPFPSNRRAVKTGADASSISRFDEEVDVVRMKKPFFGLEYTGRVIFIGILFIHVFLLLMV